MQPFSHAEIEFFIETNGRLSAERALALGTEFVRLVESHFTADQLEAIEIVHLGRGSFRSRVMVILRDRAAGPVIGLAALALGAANLLKEDGDNAFATETARACIESGAARCGFRTSEEEFLVERVEMPAIRKEQVRAAEDSNAFAEAFSPAFGRGSGQAGTAPQFVEIDSEHMSHEFNATGILVLDANVPVVQTGEHEYQISIAEGQELPPQEVLTDFHLRGPLTRYGRDYDLQGWVVRDTGAIETIVGRLIEIHDGRAVTFESIDGERYAPMVPDDTMGWVPMGALVEIKASLDDDQLTIYDWKEVDTTTDDEGDLDVESAVVSETGNPDLDDYLDAGFEPIEADDPPVVIDTDARASKKGGSRSTKGSASEAIEDGDSEVVDPVGPVTPPSSTPLIRYEGAAFTGERHMVFHSDDGDRFEIVHNSSGTQIPTAVPVVILALHTDIAPSEGLAQEAIIVEEWWARDNTPAGMKRTELIVGTFVRTTSGSFLITDRGKTFRLNNMPAGDYRGTISLSGFQSGMTDVEGNAVFDVIDVEDY